MEPYTIEWWLNIYQRCLARAFYAKSPEVMIKYDLFAIWVEERIIKKYKELNELLKLNR